MEPLYEAIQGLPPHFDGHFGYRVYKHYVEYIDEDEWTGGSKPKYWSHQEFYDEFYTQKEDRLKRGVIEFLITNKFVKTID